MIISKIKLDPFGGLSRKEVEFRSGLNVILGPNEAGKSTIFWAIQKALFTAVKLHKNVFEQEIKKYIPIGGDTAQVELYFSQDDQKYELKKTWGATQQAALRMPDGSVITDDERISKALASLLAAREGTFKAVLMTYQSGLEKTLRDLEANPETVHTLGDLLRKVVMETDGVSVDEFRTRIQRQYNEYFSHWDRDKQYPEKGRGIHNRWEKKCGLILLAFYEKEAIRVKLEDARRCEEDLDKFNKQIAEVAKRVSEKENYIKSNKKVVEDARERRTLNAEFKFLQTSIEEHKKLNFEWPVIENQVEMIKEEIPGLQAREQSLTKEKAEAELMEETRNLREKFERVNEKKKSLEKVEEELEKVKKLTREELEEIRFSATELSRLRTSLEAGKIFLDFMARNDMVISVQKDLEVEFQKELRAEEFLRTEAGGRIRLEHPDWIIEIASGEGNFKTIRERYEKLETALKELFERHEVKTIGEAIQINAEYEKSSNEVNKARESYERELGKDSYESLGSQIRDLGELKETRALATIVKELADTQNDLKSLSKEIEEKQTTLKAFAEKYESKDKLILRLADEMGKEKELQRKIEGLAPLPEGVEDIDRFIVTYEKIETILETEKEEKNALEIKRAELKEPEESSEELERQLKDVEERFKMVLTKGEATGRIKDIVEKILEDMDIGTFEQLENDLKEYVATVTEKRYSDVRIERGLPQGFIRSDGKVVFYELLSHGTKDVLGLALRLSMANHFLKDAEGFIAMDDPLVNLDPDRQRNVSEIIKDYAGKKQVLVFTCHPANAELLKGHKIEL